MGSYAECDTVHAFKNQAFSFSSTIHLLLITSLLRITIAFVVTDAQSNVPLSAEEGIRRLETSGALEALKEQGYQVLTPEPVGFVGNTTDPVTTSGEFASLRCVHA